MSEAVFWPAELLHYVPSFTGDEVDVERGGQELLSEWTALPLLPRTSALGNHALMLTKARARRERLGTWQGSVRTSPPAVEHEP